MISYISNHFFSFSCLAIPYIDQNSYSNSNNGGSVNSQDSLWKAPQLVPNDQINMQNQSMNHNHIHANTVHHQQQAPHLNHRNSGNYEQQQHHQSYNNGDDYAPYDNRSNYATDPYGPMVPKPKRRLDLIGNI